MNTSFLSICAFVLTLTACGGGGDSASTTTPTESATSTATTQVATATGSASTGTTAPTGTTDTTSSVSSPAIAYNYGSVSITSNPNANEFKPCALNNISNSVFVYSCNDGNNSTMSFSFASDTQGKVMYQWIGNQQSLLFNNLYNASYPSIDRAARRITFTNVVLNASSSAGANPAPSNTITLNGSLIF